jgi:hypothetical protein
MELGAYIDQNGNAFIGQIENTTWLHFDLPEKYTRILNEQGGEVVSIEEISFAIINHTPRGTSENFDSAKTMEFFLQQEPDQENKEYEADQLWAAQDTEYDPS